jgi:hypothetical protein
MPSGIYGGAPRQALAGYRPAGSPDPHGGDQGLDHDGANGFCTISGLAPEWNGATLVFVLDHIDGDGGNHVRDNVRMICPNCDSQLPTFKARNRGKGRHSRRERYRAGLSY